MPELPEIETVKRTLTPLLTGRTISAIKTNREEIIKHPLPEDFCEKLIGRSIVSLGRRGKYLLINLDDNSKLVAHLRMTGRLVYAKAQDEEKPHTHVIFILDNGDELRYSDVRRFGCLWLLAPEEKDEYTGMQKLGLEPLEPGCDGEYLRERLSKRKITIKQGILDQSVIAGLGNIYADEALFAARIHPARECSGLTREEWQILGEVIPPLLESAILHKGTTFSDFLDGEGNKGGNLPFLQAYAHSGKPCSKCGTIMNKIRISGRSTCFCPCCQK